MNEQDIINAVNQLAVDEGMTPEQLIDAVKAYFETKKNEQAVSKNVSEFTDMFPDVSPESIPESVWEKVSLGNPLAAAYAMYICGSANKEKHADTVNEINRTRSAPAGEEADAEAMFTPQQVEDMSQETVKKNFKNIIRSIRHWKI